MKVENKKIKRNSPGLFAKRTGALERLEKQYKTFVSKKEDKVTSRGTIVSFEQEKKRMETEISILKEILTNPISTAPKSKKRY